MPMARGSNRIFLTAGRVAIVAMSSLLAAGCGGGGDQPVQVVQKQQKQIQSLVTDDYSKMYRERYKAGRSYMPKATKAKQ